MGADTFFTYGHGRNVGEAFKRAQEDARYEHGHGGYTGTIAEKPWFIEVTLPPRVNAHIIREKIHGAEYAIAEIDGKGQDYGVKAAAKDRADLRWFIKHFGSEREVRRLLQTYNDKWGDCLAFELRGAERQNAMMHFGIKKGSRQKIYAFIGMASC